MFPEGLTVLQVVPRLEGGGVELATLDMAQALADAGARALVASRGGALETQLAARGGELIRLPVETKAPWTLWRNIGRLQALIRGEQVDLVHVRSRAPAFSAIAAARRAGVPVVATYHGIYSARGPAKRWYNGVMTRADATLANSRYTLDHVLAEHRLPADRLILTPEGIDTDRFNPDAVSGERVRAARQAMGLDPFDAAPVLLLAARLTGWKGQGVMIQALARMRDRSPMARLVLAGKAQTAEARDDLLRLAAKAGISARLHIPGPLADMPAALLAADLIVAPSTQAESFGRSVAEAQAMGRLVLASPLGGPAEIIAPGETGWLVAADDTAAWAQAVDAALDLPDSTRQDMGARARARVVHHWSLAASTAAHFRAYRQVLEGRR